MAWDLDGSTQYFDCIMPAAVKAAAGGPFTMIAFCDLDASTDGAFMCNMSGSSVFQVMEIFTSFNYGTSAGTRNGPVATAQTPSAVGNPYIVIISKNTGNVAPEYTLIPWVSGAPGTPVSGTITGGGATLGDGVAPGASGFIRCGQYGTSTAERVNGRIIALAQYTAYKDSTARALLDSWADWLNTSGPGAGLAWAMEFTALTTRTDASGNGGDESARNGTTPYTLVADPANFFPSSGTTAADTSPPAALRWRSTQETAVANGVSSDVSAPGALRWRSSLTESGLASVVAADSFPPGALRWRGRSTDAGVVNVVAADSLVSGLRWRSLLSESAAIGMVAADTPFLGYRFRDSAASGDVATIGADTVISGWRWRSRLTDGAVIDVTGVDTRPLGWRLRQSQTGVVSSVVGTDTPNGLRWRAGATGSIVNPPDEGTDVIGYDLNVLGWRIRESPVGSAIGMPVEQPVTLFTTIGIEHYYTSVKPRSLITVVEVVEL